MAEWVDHHQKFIEIISCITGLVYLYFSVRQKIWLWPLGILSSAFSVVVFFQSQLYADMSLNSYYLVISVYGWAHWLRSKDNSYHSSIKISVLLAKDWIIYLSVASVLSLAFAMVLIYLPQKLGLQPSSVPWWDAFLTSGSVVATWMLARKVLEQWLWWIVIDGISIGVLMYKGLYFMSALFVVYTLMAVIGYLKWKKDLLAQ